MLIKEEVTSVSSLFWFTLRENEWAYWERRRKRETVKEKLRKGGEERLQEVGEREQVRNTQETREESTTIPYKDAINYDGRCRISARH